MTGFAATRGTIPVLISMPHAGTEVPDALFERLNATGRALGDDDRMVDSLYAEAAALGASTIWARHSRYLVDLNRPADDTSLYPGQATTGLFPTETFDGEPIYRPGCEPDDAERNERLARWWRPYHRWLAEELERLRAEHGHVLLWEGHSIRSRVPRLFEGTLPELNIGTHDGASCIAGLGEAMLGLAERAGYRSVLNGRFKGGYITRHYGRPDAGISAVQLEVGWDAYLTSDERAVDARKRARLAEAIGEMIETAVARIGQGSG